MSQMTGIRDQGSDLEAAERRGVLREAASWLGTAFHDDACVKVKRDPHFGIVTDRGGVDCAHSVYAIYRAAVPHRVKALDIKPYPRQWHLSKHSGGQELYLKHVLEVAREIDPAAARPADLVLYRLAHAFAHGALIAAEGWPHILHASETEGGFVRSRGDQGLLAGREKKFFTLW